MRIFLAVWLFVVVATVSILGFRGDKSRSAPRWVFPDMDIQAKYLPQGQNEFFADERNDRPMVPGAVLRGYNSDIKEVFDGEYVFAKAENPALFTGLNESGKPVTEFPLEVTYDLVQLGQKKYTIFCQPCHGRVGDGMGITKKYGMSATPTYHDDGKRALSVGDIFNTITHGKGTMFPYGMKLNPQERWAVVAYVRALQLSQNATVNDVPTQYRKELGL
ncbi:c-type cytochrome [Cerasicoccus arenae]|uniref:Quinol:cytochrome C oxidoreductase n=1 Tax=Cerasicoccus arenae TaxID=424488 RepID=A0A8J3DIE5_9BACT|nr:cytochrome c [Cerasicoccus arenae]MBK1858540.1 cytochrome c [Cerasicoccus arenae]GHC06175.1 quinol:cytochrome C oxidoreductase [Cerasicoccus arenae]